MENQETARRGFPLQCPVRPETIPPQAKWIGQNKKGTWLWFLSRPKIGLHGWWMSSAIPNVDFGFLQPGIPPAYIGDTLIELRA